MDGNKGCQPAFENGLFDNCFSYFSELCPKTQNDVITQASHIRSLGLFVPFYQYSSNNLACFCSTKQAGTADFARPTFAGKPVCSFL